MASGAATSRTAQISINRLTNVKQANEIRSRRFAKNARI
jgi:hypothetical protein